MSKKDKEIESLKKENEELKKMIEFKDASIEAFMRVICQKDRTILELEELLTKYRP